MLEAFGALAALADEPGEIGQLARGRLHPRGDEGRVCVGRKALACAARSRGGLSDRSG